VKIWYPLLLVLLLKGREYAALILLNLPSYIEAHYTVTAGVGGCSVLAREDCVEMFIYRNLPFSLR
jgi:hypothetical protein